MSVTRPTTAQIVSSFPIRACVWLVASSTMFIRQPRGPAVLANRENSHPAAPVHRNVPSVPSVCSVSSLCAADSIGAPSTSSGATSRDPPQSHLLRPSARRLRSDRIIPSPNQNIFCESNSALDVVLSSPYRDSRAAPHCHASAPSCPPADNVATNASPADNTTATGGCIPQFQSPCGHSSHHLHSLQLKTAHSRPLQPDLPGWRPQSKGSFLLSSQGDTIKKSFNIARQSQAKSITLMGRRDCTLSLNFVPLREVQFGATDKARSDLALLADYGTAHSVRAMLRVE
jgi:hypothetical protein